MLKSTKLRNKIDIYNPVTLTQNHLDPLFRTVSRGSRGSSGVSSQKVQRVVLSIQSVLPSKGHGESLRKLEKVRES